MPYQPAYAARSPDDTVLLPGDGGAALRLGVLLPAGRVPDLEVVVDADQHHFLAQPGELHQPVGDGDPAVGGDRDLFGLGVVEPLEYSHIDFAGRQVFQALSIYKGKVVNVLPGMGASFCDIGLGRNAFLYVDDINKTPLNIGDVEVTQGRSGYTITEKVSRGDDVLVQIVKEPRGLKGARVSTNISLPGRYLILMPTGKFSGVSRKIESADERNRLKAVMKAIRPEGMATVVRTAAANVSNAELIADLGVLIRMWHGILEQYKRVPRRRCCTRT